MLGLKIRRTTKLEETLCSYIYPPYVNDTSMTKLKKEATQAATADTTLLTEVG